MTGALRKRGIVVNTVTPTKEPATQEAIICGVTGTSIAANAIRSTTSEL